MATKVAELAVDITVNGAPQVTKALKGVEESGKQASKVMQDAMTLVRGYFGLQTVKAVTKMAEDWQSIAARVGLYAKNASDAQVIQSKLLTTANATRSSLEDQATLYTRIAAQASALGATSQQILAVTKLVGQANAVSGASASEAAAGVTQLAQALGSGKLAGDELKSILENSPRLAKAIADGLGVSVGQLKEMGAQGKLLSSDVFAALLTQSEQLSNEFAKIPPTIGGAITVMTNSLTESIGSLNQQLGITKGIAQFILNLFGDDRMQLFFGENPLESRTGTRGKGRIFFANRGDVRRTVEENARAASQAAQNPLFGSGGGFGGPGFGLTPQFNPTLANTFGQYGGMANDTGPRGGAIADALGGGSGRSGRGSGLTPSRVGALSGIGGVRNLGRGSGIARLTASTQLAGGVGQINGVDTSGVFGAIASQAAALAEAAQPALDTARGIGTSIVDGIANGITAAVQSGSIKEGLRTLGGSLIGGVGSMLKDFGQKMLLASTLMESLFKSLASFLPGGSITASIGLIALGSVMVGLGQKAARSSFGGAGRSDGFSGGGFNIPSTISTTGTVGLPSSVIADGRTPITSSGSAVTQATPMVVNVFSPDDPTTQRFFRETLRRADGRGSL